MAVVPSTSYTCIFTAERVPAWKCIYWLVAVEVNLNHCTLPVVIEAPEMLPSTHLSAVGMSMGGAKAAVNIVLSFQSSLTAMAFMVVAALIAIGVLALNNVPSVAEGVVVPSTV